MDSAGPLVQESRSTCVHTLLLPGSPCLLSVTITNTLRSSTYKQKKVVLACGVRGFSP